jgi:hypothetical protein
MADRRARARMRRKDWGCSSVVKCLPRMHETLGLILSTTKKKKKKSEKR